SLELLLVEGIGEEDPLTSGVVALVQQAVDQLVAEIGHPQPVDVWEGQREAQPVSVRLVDRAALGGQKIFDALDQTIRHALLRFSTGLSRSLRCRSAPVVTT